MLVSNAAAGALFLGTHVVVGRSLDGVDYALVVALLGLLSMLGVPQATLQIVIARFAADPAADLAAAWVRLLRWSVRKVTLLGLVGMGAWAVSLPWSRRLVPGASTMDLLLVAIVAWIGLYQPVFSGALQGRYRFLWLAASGTGGALTRFVLAGLAAAIWGRVDVVLLAWVASYAVSLVLAFWPLRADVRRQSAQPAAFEDARLRSYAAKVFLGQIAFFALLNADLVLAPRLLDGVDVAIYSKVAMLCRSVLFLPIPVVLAMFPRAVASRKHGVLLGPLLFAFVVSGAGAMVLWLWPSLPLQLMFGVSGPEYAALVRLYVWAAVPLALNVVVVHYLWARDGGLAALALGPVVAAYLTVLIRFQGDLAHLPLILGGAAVATLLAFGIAMLRFPGFQPGR